MSNLISIFILLWNLVRLSPVLISPHVTSFLLWSSFFVSIVRPQMSYVNLKFMVCDSYNSVVAPRAQEAVDLTKLFLKISFLRAVLKPLLKMLNLYNDVAIIVLKTSPKLCFWLSWFDFWYFDSLFLDILILIARRCENIPRVMLD